MRLLVTGGAGFIGSNVVHHIIDRRAVKRLIVFDCLTYAGRMDNLSGVISHPKFYFEMGDLCDREAVLRVMSKQEITHVLHLAAESHVDRSISDPGRFVQTNVVGTCNLLDACCAVWGTDFQNRCFHHVSTDEVYGSLGATGNFTETSRYAPSSPYSASKAGADMLVQAYHRTYGLPTVITHCSNNYGPRQFPEKLIPLVIRCVMSRTPIPIYGDGMNVRDWLFVVDHAEALWQVLTRGRVGDTYNIGGNSEVHNLRLVEEICDLCDEIAPHVGGTSRSLITFVPDRPGHDRRYAIDAGKIRGELGWFPQYTLERGLRETTRWYLDHQEWAGR